MPIYEYIAERCLREPACSRRMAYLQSIKESPVRACRDCGASIERVFSTFAARSGEFGVSSPDPTPLNITNIPAPRHMPTGEGCSGSGHSHE